MKYWPGIYWLRLRWGDLMARTVCRRRGHVTQPYPNIPLGVVVYVPCSRCLWKVRP